MKVFAKIFFIFSFLIVFCFYWLLQCVLPFGSELITFALADDEFKTSYHITYTINKDASVFVQQNISLENKLANVYATEYQINLGATQVSGVTAWDKQGSIAPQLESKENSTTVNLAFNQKVVGKGEQFEFGLSFLTADFAFLNGKVLQIGIPKLADSQSLAGYQIILKIPVSFEEPIFINPEPRQIQKLVDFNIYSFEQNQLIDQSVFAAFGEKQFMDFNLHYNLNNPHSSPGLFEIALPPETAWQKIVLNTLEPEPENVRVDADGNWLAEYALDSHEKLEVLATGSATLYLEPQPIKLALVKDLATLLKTQEYWPVDHEQIKSLVQQRQTPAKIYDYVVQTLDYNYDKVEQNPKRMGAILALAEPDQAVCMEFTDLFVTLARAAGIPAREINGYAYTKNPRLRRNDRAGRAVGCSENKSRIESASGQ